MSEALRTVMGMTAQLPPPSHALDPEPGSSDRKAMAVLVLACMGQFVGVLDASIVNVALPAMGTELNLTPTGLQWVINAYVLAFAGLLLLGGRASDIYGERRVFVVGASLFTLASLLGGIATTPTQLIVARAVQGLGAAVLAPTTLTILTTTFPKGPRQTKAIASWTAVGAAGGAAGGTLGGVLTEYLSWRWTLLINVPIGIALVITALIVITRSHYGQGRRLDVLGTILVTAGLTALAYGTVQTHEHGWVSAEVLVPLGAGVLSLAAFLLVQSRTTQPLVPLGLLRNRLVAGSSLAMFLMGTIFLSMWYFLSLHMQDDLDYTPLQAGIGFLPHALTMIVASRAAPWFLRRMGNRTLIVAGALVGLAGMVWQAQMADGYITGILIPGFLMCAGASVSYTPIALIGTAGIDRSNSGLVSGLLTASRTVGGSLGLAALATVAATQATPAQGSSAAFLVGAGLMAITVAVVLLVLPRGAGHSPAPEPGR
ncbi:MFS transporter [Acrocarpospora macrocephala]|uniref:MFS transporter n=2 Tax=Acrocarpospora macrocephala TaxID=150177 RepID=A0A5M3WWC6_9ACTN|nr:MFS transporter [Acrocarpospora macrocephala]